MKTSLQEMLELFEVPEELIADITSRSTEYQEEFSYALKRIMKNEVIMTIAYLEARESVNNKQPLANSEA